MQWLLAAMNPTPTDNLIWPDFQILLDTFINSPDLLFSSKSEYTRSVEQPLSGITLSSGNTFRAFQGFQIERDVINAGKSVIISMPNMIPSFQEERLQR